MNCNFINIDDNNILILDNVYQISTLLNIDLFQNKFIKFDKSYLPKYIKKLKKMVINVIILINYLDYNYHFSLVPPSYSLA